MIVIKQRTKHIQRITYCSIFPTFHIRGWNDEHRKTSLLRSCWIRTTVTHRWYDDVSSYVLLLVQHSRLSQQTTFVLETLTVFSSISLIIINSLCSKFLLLSHFPKDNVDPDKSQNLNLGWRVAKGTIYCKIDPAKSSPLATSFLILFSAIVLFWIGAINTFIQSKFPSVVCLCLDITTPLSAGFFFSKKYPMRDTKKKWR